MNLSILIAAIFIAQSAPAPVGMIIQTEGRVLVVHEGRSSQAKLADMLYAGDQVSGKTTFMFCPSSEKVSLRNGTSLELRADGWKVLKGSVPDKSATRCMLPRAAIGAENMERIGGLRTRGELDPPAIPLYIGGAITKTRPTLEWARVDKADSYHVILRSADGKVIFDDQSKSTIIIYPLFKGSLDAGTYEWEVKAMGSGKELAQDMATFEVKPQPVTFKSVVNLAQGVISLGNRLLSQSDQLLRAVELENDGYYAEAADLYRLLRRSQPDDSRLTKHLAWLYLSAGLSSAATEELQRMK
jgi:hypothetical protein